VFTPQLPAGSFQHPRRQYNKSNVGSERRYNLSYDHHAALPWGAAYDVHDAGWRCFIAGFEIDPDWDDAQYRTAAECVDAAAAGATVHRYSYFYGRCFSQPIDSPE
jgi:hypothetical protein